MQSLLLGSLNKWLFSWYVVVSFTQQFSNCVPIVMAHLPGHLVVQLEKGFLSGSFTLVIPMILQHFTLLIHHQPSSISFPFDLTLFIPLPQKQQDGSSLRISLEGEIVLFEFHSYHRGGGIHLV